MFYCPCCLLFLWYQRAFVTFLAELLMHLWQQDCLLSHRLPRTQDSITECRNVAKPIKQHFSITAGPSWAAEGNNQSLDFRRSLFIMQSGTSPYTFHPASSSGEEEGHQQSLSNHCCWKLSPHVPLPPHNPLFKALPVTATRTNWNFWWWRSQFLLRNKGKMCV